MKIRVQDISECHPLVYSITYNTINYIRVNTANPTASLRRGYKTDYIQTWMSLLSMINSFKHRICKYSNKLHPSMK